MNGQQVTTGTAARRQTVNHSITFVGVHMQNAKSYWSRVKTELKRMKGVCEPMLNFYFDKFMWRESHK